MGWVIALFAAVVFGGLWLKERERRGRELRAVRQWLQDLAAGRMPGAPLGTDTPELENVSTEASRVGEQIETLRRNQTAEAANLQNILTSMPEGVLLTDAKHVIRLANPSLLQVLDLKANPTGKSVLEGVRDVHFEELVTATFADGKVHQIELTLTHIKPARHVTVNATPIRDAAGERAVLVICHDTTRLKQLEDVRREFVANVSHELRTPLSIFQGYLENLLDFPDVTREELIGNLEILRRHSTRLNAIVEDLLVLARLESRTDILCLEMIEPRKLLEDMVADWKLNAARKNIELSAVCTADAPEFEADAFRIEQVLNNLIDNAVKYTASGGRVSLRASGNAESIQFRVEDTGGGIPPQDLPHIFERFYRADKARSREHGGTGLGLSIVKHIVQKHGGSASAESVYGKGTAIILTLPARQNGTSLPSQPSREMQARVNSYEDQAESRLVN